MESGQIQPEVAPSRRQLSLRRKRDFESISKIGLSRVNPLLVLRAVPNDLTYSRSAFIVSRKVQTRAVVRNKIRRRFRHIIRNSPLTSGWDMLFIARKGCSRANYQELLEAVRNVARRANILRKE